MVRFDSRYHPPIRPPPVTHLRDRRLGCSAVAKPKPNISRYMMDPACDELACSQPEGEDSEYGCRAGGVSTQSVPTSRTSAERCGTGCASSDTVRWRTGAGGGAELTRRQHGRPFCASFCSAGRFCGTGGSYARGDHHICSGCSAIFARIDSGCYTECATDCDCDLGTCQPLVSPHITHITSFHFTSHRRRATSLVELRRYGLAHLLFRAGFENRSHQADRQGDAW